MKIAVIGAGLSGLAAAWHLQQQGHETVVLEAADRPGGRCATIRRDGFIIDTGPELATAGYKRWQSLATNVGLGNDVVRSNMVISAIRDGKLIEMNAGNPLAMLFTPMLSWSAKLKLARGVLGMRNMLRSFDPDNPLASASLDDPGLNAEEFAVAAFGREAADYLIAPLIRGIGGTRMNALSSLLVLAGLRGMAQPIISLRGGFDRVPRAVADRLQVRYRTRVARVYSTAQGASIEYVDAHATAATLQVDKCLVAVQYDDAECIYPPFAEMAGGFGQRLTFARLLDVKLAYSNAPATRSTLIQVPPEEEKDILMFFLAHNKSPDRAPPGHGLFTVFSDHEQYERLAALDDQQIVVWARGHIERWYPEVKEHFLFSHIERQPRTIGFADPGYFRRTKALWDAIGGGSNVQLGGDLFGAGSMEAAVMCGERAAARLMATQ